jgi:hypothetical protein
MKPGHGKLADLARPVAGPETPEHHLPASRFAADLEEVDLRRGLRPGRANAEPCSVSPSDPIGIGRAAARGRSQPVARMAIFISFAKIFL